MDPVHAVQVKAVLIYQSLLFTKKAQVIVLKTVLNFTLK